MSPDPYTGRLVHLRAREAEDAPTFHRWFNDYEVPGWLGVRYPISRAGESNLLGSTPEPGFRRAAFAVETRDEHRLIGNCELQAHLEDRCATLGIALGERERGFGTDTMRALCRVGFEVMNLNRIELTVDAMNHRARHVYRKVGFVEEGELRDHRFLMGAYRNTAVMGLFRTELNLEDER